jgi:hypothetical protein
MSLAEAAKLLQNLPERESAASPAEIKRQMEILEKQENDMRMANILKQGVSKLHNSLKEAKTAGMVRANLYEFYDKLAIFIRHDDFRDTLQNSNAVKLLIGIYREFMDILDILPDKGDITGDKRLERLNVFFHDFSTALQLVNMSKTWDTVEQSITTLIKVTGVEEKEMADLNYHVEVTNPAELQKIIENREILEVLDGKPIDGALEMYAAGQTDLAEMARLAGIWEEVKAKVYAITYPGDYDENTN